MKHLVAAASLLLCLFAVERPAQGQVFQWTNGTGANGHFYEVIIAPGGISWAEADYTAGLRGGYLATLNTPEENAFVFSMVNLPYYWVNDAAGNSQGPWIGGFQQAGSTEPDGGWQWVNNEG